MADPITWGVILAGAGAAVSAVGAIKQAQAASAAADYNAAVSSQNAQIAEAQGEAAAQAHQRDTQRRIGAMVAAYGASGVQGADGSPADVLADSVRSATLDNLTLKYNYKLRALGYQNQSQLDQFNSKTAMEGGYWSAASSLISGGSKVASFYGASPNSGSTGNLNPFGAWTRP